MAISWVTGEIGSLEVVWTVFTIENVPVDSTKTVTDVDFEIAHDVVGHSVYYDEFELTSEVTSADDPPVEEEDITYVTIDDHSTVLPSSIQHENILETNKHTPKAHDLNSHSDVVIASPVANHFLAWDTVTSKWINRLMAGGGDVSKVGTPADNQVGVWTGDGTIEGHASLTYDRSNLQLTGDIGSTGTRITKGWFTDLQVTNAIAGSITGNAATVSTITGLAPDTATTQATQAAITSAANLVTVGTIGAGAWEGTDVGVTHGGTGKSAWTQYLIPYADTTTSLAQIAIGTDGQVLTSAGAGVAPAFEDAGGGAFTVIETAVLAADTSIDFVGLDSNNYYFYRIFMNVENLSGGDTPDVNIQINGDAVENNYWRMYWTAGGYHTAASYGMGLIKDNETAMYNITAMIDNNGRTKIWADVMGGGKAAGTNYDVKNLIEHYNNVQTRITSIKLISERAGSLTGTVVLWGLPV